MFFLLVVIREISILKPNQLLKNTAKALTPNYLDLFLCFIGCFLVLSDGDEDQETDVDIAEINKGVFRVL